MGKNRLIGIIERYCSHIHWSFHTVWLARFTLSVITGGVCGAVVPYYCETGMVKAIGDVVHRLCYGY